MIDNRKRQIDFQASPTTGVKSGQKLKLTARSPNSVGVAFYHNGQLLDKAVGAAGEVEVDTRRLGFGPVSLTAIGWGSGGLENNVYAKPIALNIEP